MVSPYENGNGRREHSLTPDDAGLVAAQVGAITSAGLPLASGLRATAREMPQGRVRWALHRMVSALEGGMSIDEAVGAAHGRLPEHLRGIMQIGSKTGKTSEILGRFLVFANVGTDLRMRLWIRLAYPALTMLLAFCIFVFLVSALGTFTSVFRDFGIQLPWVTEVLMAASRYFQVGWTIGAESLVGVVLFFVFIRFFMTEKVRRGLIARVPILGAVWRNTSLAEFCHLLALLLESEIPLDQAVRLTGEGVQDSAIDLSCKAMAAEIAGGLTLSQAITRKPVFPVGLARVLRWAEGHQGLAESLHTTAEMFEARARAQASFAGTVLAILAVLLMIFTILTVIFGVFLPMYNLISRLI
jgi:general secretion pathway protein F